MKRTLGGGLAFILFMIFVSCDTGIDTQDTPVIDDFLVGELKQTYNGNPKIVSVTAKDGKTSGNVICYYSGVYGTKYDKSEESPSAVGMYAVTFDVEAADGFNAVKDLSAGTLVIENDFSSAHLGETVCYSLPSVPIGIDISELMPVEDSYGRSHTFTDYTISEEGNELMLRLGVPSVLFKYSDFTINYSYSPSDLETYTLDTFSYRGRGYEKSLYLAANNGNGYNLGHYGFIYSNTDGTIKGYNGSQTVYNVSLKKGWNTVFIPQKAYYSELS